MNGDGYNMTVFYLIRLRKVEQLVRILKVYQMDRLTNSQIQLLEKKYRLKYKISKIILVSNNLSKVQVHH